MCSIVQRGHDLLGHARFEMGAGGARPWGTAEATNIGIRSWTLTAPVPRERTGGGQAGVPHAAPVRSKSQGSVKERILRVTEA